MKQLFILAYLFAGILVFSCTDAKEKTAEELLSNPKTEDEIYSAIIDNKLRMEKFMERMMHSDDCKMMMMKNSSMVKMMCSSEKMDSLMHRDVHMMESMTNNLMNIVEKDSVVCDKTCSKMMESDRFRKRITEQMMLQQKK